MDKSKILGRVMIISGIILVISGISFIVLGVFNAPNMNMDFDEFAAAMELSGMYSMMGILMTAGGSFLILPGIFIQFYGGSSTIKEKLSSKRTSNIYANVSPTLKGRASKDIISCPFCHKEFKSGLKICPECGSEL
jgi:uncharacterized membrane protein